MHYPDCAQELVQLLKADQTEWREFARKEFETEDKPSLDAERTLLRQKVHQRARRMLEILEGIGTPTLNNIGSEAAQAMSILTLHDSLRSLEKVLSAFTECLKHQKSDTYYQAIPSMTDWQCLLERRPQQFGTIWLFDNNKEPFLPTVDDFEGVNERRNEYGIEPLHWPKSLAIPEEHQPWLKRPLLQLVMRKPTPTEYAEFSKDYLD